MRKNIKKLAVTGLLSIFISLTALVFRDNLNQFSETAAMLIITIFFILAIIFLSIATNLVGKGDNLILNDLVPGVEYVLIMHVSINGSKSFSLVGKPDSEKFVSIHGDDSLYTLLDGQKFIIPLNDKSKIVKID